MKIAIFGGSFDPPHNGHVMIVEKALETLDIDKLFVIPTYLSPFKKTFCAPPQMRKIWLEKLFLPYKKVEVFSYECDQERPVPTIETVKYLMNKYELSKIYLIIGSDHYASLVKWHNHEELSTLVEFVVASRDTTKLPKDLKNLSINVNISSSKLRDFLDETFIPKAIQNEVKEYYTRNQMDNRNEKIVFALSEKKAEDIQVFDMRNKDYFVNSVVIATTMGERHGLSLLDHLKTELKGAGEVFLNVDADNNWTVIDMGDILIHLMTPEYRAKYNLELFLKERELEMKRVRGVE
ncbi:MAG: nicotinate (nicotinamide) nucleotide adenylyltransferase [Campylobacteraceae bacterium]|nr:nicotinate (nicotinamide) nucleotide adenylyltransferase [Campylobacteraceae bacterium]